MTNKFIIQRGRQKSVKEIFGALDIPDYYFDFRELTIFKKFSPFALFIKAFMTSFEFPKDIDFLLCEGALCTLVGIFYKIRNPKTFLAAYIIDPAFWVKNKNSFKLLIRSKLHRKFVDHSICITKMVQDDALNNKFVSSIKKTSIISLPSTIRTIKTINSYSNRSFALTGCISIIYIIDRPEDTQYTKGLDIVLEICKKLYYLNKNFKLNIYGKGTENLNIEAPWLIKHGYSENLLKEYEYADFFILPSRYDASSIALIESISYGLIPIVSEKVGSNEFLKTNIDNINFIIDIKEINLWAQQILFFNSLSNKLKDNIVKELRENIKDNTYETTLEKFKELLTRFD